jgi:Fe2+ transport system protein FeoA
MSLNSHINLVAFSEQRQSINAVKLEGIKGAHTSLKTRLLEVGFTKGVSLSVFRNGGHFLIKLRGDTLLLRTSEARHLIVSGSIG